MKSIIALLITGSVVSLAGYWLLGSVNWKLMVGVFLVMWGVNIMNAAPKMIKDAQTLREVKRVNELFTARAKDV